MAKTTKEIRRQNGIDDGIDRLWVEETVLFLWEHGGAGLERADSPLFVEQWLSVGRAGLGWAGPSVMHRATCPWRPNRFKTFYPRKCGDNNKKQKPIQSAVCSNRLGVFVATKREIITNYDLIESPKSIGEQKILWLAASIIIGRLQ